MLRTNRTFAERLYALWSRYGMWDAENDDEAAFERRLDAVVREIGERGKLIVAESVPPVRERAPPAAAAPPPAAARTHAASANPGHAAASAPAHARRIEHQPRGELPHTVQHHT